ncbi:MAG TPA: gluconate 2-dehydrogenase subunit 3 family protein [Blastocatellia bacterium]|nr:gluconate 2-dehydrogenase subunit 3 family protein [Blastocatellia bacterium]
MADKIIETEQNRDETELTRREIIKLAAGAVVAAPIVGLAKAQAGIVDAASASQNKAPLFFTPKEFALADELTELIIPTDDHSPGARAAEVTAYIDKRLAESFEEEPKKSWREGLKLIDSLSQESFGRAFLEATPEQRIELLKRISKNERDPKQPEEIFFKELKNSTVRAYYTSKIGIHAEMQYKGNVSLKEFVGFDAN